MTMHTGNTLNEPKSEHIKRMLSNLMKTLTLLISFALYLGFVLIALPILLLAPLFSTHGGYEK